MAQIYPLLAMAFGEIPLELQLDFMCTLATMSKFRRNEDFRGTYAAMVSAFACIEVLSCRSFNRNTRRSSVTSRCVQSHPCQRLPYWLLQHGQCNSRIALMVPHYSRKISCEILLPPADRVKAIVAAMNITEKIANTVEYSNLPHNLPRQSHLFVTL